ncbi:hypothetical protein XELAEV_18011345mg [Xenopus laevis]|uniref:Ig-like domain-containing protein n=1 Tax=Xenopus laevis TaxID=8355 RepID=A0A974DLP4_XENLA|nr:hypothetical protein XELAEV_18011345mg [Xenopus laevis]
MTQHDRDCHSHIQIFKKNTSVPKTDIPVRGSGSIRNNCTEEAAIEPAEAPHHLYLNRRHIRMKIFIFNLFFTIFPLSAGLDCTPQIHTEKNTKYNKSVGEFLAIQCPVSFCSEELPHVTWCRLVRNTCEPIDSGSRLVMGWTGQKKNTAVYLLMFLAAELDDTGFYRCTLITQSVNTIGFTVTVTVTGGHTELTTTQLPSKCDVATQLRDILYIQTLDVLLFGKILLSVN